ncbi:hypothetical protein ANANG_G00313030, partial [Anguilla anguilla]
RGWPPRQSVRATPLTCRTPAASLHQGEANQSASSPTDAGVVVRVTVTAALAPQTGVCEGFGSCLVAWLREGSRAAGGPVGGHTLRAARRLTAFAETWTHRKV